MKFAPALAIVAAIGCSDDARATAPAAPIVDAAPPRVPVSFRVDPSFSDADRGEIARAALIWNDLTLPASRISLEGGDWRLYRVDVTRGGFNGFCSPPERLIEIDSEPVGASLFEVALHEFGHAVGLEHTTTGVMMARTVSTDFTFDVFLECQRAGACLIPNLPCDIR